MHDETDMSVEKVSQLQQHRGPSSYQRKHDGFATELTSLPATSPGVQQAEDLLRKRWLSPVAAKGSVTASYVASHLNGKSSSSSSSYRSLGATNTASSSGWLDPSAMNPPKIGGRFSIESSKLLTEWFTRNAGYPYPSKTEMETLQHQTGLAKEQIKNWLGNRRRREKMREALQNKAAVKCSTTEWPVVPVDIAQRPGTPAVSAGRHREMSPLERWVDLIHHLTTNLPLLQISPMH
ncbi:hypothetical protein NQ176_g3345 [Zarea fungicola]|uniref:Uncharacterized protein n=1 Tax=Zarea fungicola TaxID=93591 RepID=A0ACC1NJ32_9HYPO|nr:hypothetical protein NQ176_g3345 [Lecanicillium fungicola]